MTDALLLFFAPLLFGLLVGLVTGMSSAEGSGIAFIGGVLGGGILAQLVTSFLMSLAVDSVLIVLAGFSVGGLAGFSVGGLAGVLGGIGLRMKGIAIRVVAAKKGTA